MLKVTWAHPEYGQVLASCSFDRTVKIWEESEYGIPPTLFSHYLEAKSGGRRWIEKAKLTDSRFIIQDIQFCPHKHGLKLVC